ncbi:hypothetical protein BGZ80_009590 [Entomortierella chlamydospora]|uniref:Septin-type G domain-containing protein n=1 Tax=Entomortierella chlamydospora TaxID=101097 RepID=A0A9P6T0C1_9FUNG|nr:hypothetical protein BGZ80_009590 [Entomortierella chlamydospora]
MQRFTRLEDLADLEQLGVPEQAPSTGISTSAVMNTGVSTNMRPSAGIARPNPEHRTGQDRIRQYINANTTYLNSADTEGSGYIPNQATLSQLVQSHGHHVNSGDEDSVHISRTPHYSSSLAEDDNYSLPSSPSLGYYSHASRPSSQTGFWADQDVSSLNLIMPSSAMFTKGRESTADGDKLGFVKMMVAGKSRTHHSRLIQEMFKWDGVVANDFEDEFLQDRRSLSVTQNTMENDQASHPYVSHSAHGSYSSQSSAQQDESSLQERYRGVAQVIVERFASSMVLPAWARAGLDEQDMQHEILIKNICFVDTPGYESFNNPSHAMDLVVSYLGLQFQTTNEFFSSSAVSNDSLGRFLANNSTGAHSHVDVCIYVIEGHLTDMDIVYMQRLQSWVNLLPVLILTGATHGNIGPTLSPHSINVDAVRMGLIKQLRDNDIEVYGMDEYSARVAPTPSPHLTDTSQDEDISSPPLSMEGNSRNSEYASPPFVFFIPEDIGNANAVQQLDVTGDKEHLQGLASSNLSAASFTPFESSQWSDMESMRKWIYVNNLAALRHQTTLKFLRWRRHKLSMIPSPMFSSQESDSFLRPQPNNQRYPLSEYPGSHGINTNSSPSGVIASQQPQQQPLPSELLSDLLSSGQKRLSAKAARIIETHSQTFERIMMERQAAWRLALEGIEREQRIDFLVQELKRWAIEGQSERLGRRGRNTQNNPPVHILGLGAETGNSSLLSTSRDRSADERTSSRRNRSKRSQAIKSDYPSRISKSPRSEGESQEDGNDDNDPLGMGLWMGQFFGAVGRSIVHVVVMVGMGSLATWIYTNFLENRVTWIG